MDGSCEPCKDDVIDSLVADDFGELAVVSKWDIGGTLDERCRYFFGERCDLDLGEFRIVDSNGALLSGVLGECKPKSIVARLALSGASDLGECSLEYKSRTGRTFGDS